VQTLQSKLDDKHSECEELQAAMQKARGEALRRQEQQRAESEEKIASLLAQLRAAEARLMETSTSLRKSQDLAGLRASNSSNSGGLAAALRRSDAELGDYVQSLLGDERGAADSAVGFQREIVRRWQSEKERREALERRNAELLRDLRALKGR